jgi:hypothetical protein
MFQDSTRARPRPLTLAETDGSGRPRASRTSLTGDVPSSDRVHTPAAGLSTSTKVVPSSRSWARKWSFCTTGTSRDTVTDSPFGPASVTPVGPPSAVTSQAALRSPFGSLVLVSVPAARARAGLTARYGARSQPVNASKSKFQVAPAPT